MNLPLALEPDPQRDIRPVHSDAAPARRIVNGSGHGMLVPVWDVVAHGRVWQVTMMGVRSIHPPVTNVAS